MQYGWYVQQVFRRIKELKTIPLIVVGDFRQPLINMCCIQGISNSSVNTESIKSYRVVFCRSFPIYAPGRRIHLFNQGETTFDSWPVLFDEICARIIYIRFPLTFIVLNELK